MSQAARVDEVIGPIFLMIAGFSGGALGTELPRLTVTAKTPSHEASQEDGGNRVERKIIDPRGPKSLPRLLRESPSILVRDAGGEGSAPEYLIRGQDPHQTRYFLEDIPLSDAAYDSAPVHWLPLDALGAVDIYPEGVPVRLGGDGLGGALRFSFPRGEELKSWASARVGSYSYREVSGLGASKGSQIFAGYRESLEDFSFVSDHGTPFETSDDTIEKRTNNHFRRFTLLPKILLSESGSDPVQAFGLGVWNEMGVPGPVGQTNGGKLNQGYGLGAVDWKHEKAWRTHLYGRWARNIFHNENYATISQAIDESRSEEGRLGVGTCFSSGDALVQMGTNYEHFQLETIGGPTPGKRGSGRWQWESGLSRTISVGKWVVQPAIALHFYQYLPESGGDRRETVLLSPRIGSSFEPLPSWRLRASAGSYFRAPSLFELYGSPAGFSSSPGLNSERAEKLEIGADKEWRRAIVGTRSVKASYSYSIAFARDLIAYLQNSQSTRVATNIGNSRIDSHEVALETAFQGVPLFWKNAFAILWTENRTPIPSQQGKELPERAPWRWQMDLSWMGERLSVGYSLSWSGPVFSDLSNLRKRSSTQDHSLWAGVATPGWGRFRLEVRNLLNTLKVDSLFAGEAVSEYTTGYAGFPAPGRRVYLSWQYEL